jgi:hypothetical protein
MLINSILFYLSIAIVFFVCVPGILFTIPTNSVYLTTALHSVIFVLVHRTVMAHFKKNLGIQEPRM